MHAPHSARRRRRGFVAGAVLLGSLATMVGFAPSAYADTDSEISITSTAGSTYQLQKEGAADQFANEGAAVPNKASHTFTGLGEGTYRVVVTNPDCNTKVSAEATVSGVDGNDGNIPKVDLVCDFVPLTPKRILETRATGAAPGVTHINPAASVPAEQTGKTSANGGVGSIYKVDVTTQSSGVPSGALAVALNVTATEVSGDGNFITVWDCEDAVNADDTFEPDAPTASSLNVPNGGTRPNAVITKVGASNQICIFSLRSTHLIVDVTGYFPGGEDGAGQYMSFVEDGPDRVLETRGFNNSVTPPIVQTGYLGPKPPANAIIKVDTGAPDNADAIINVTGVDGSGGHVTVWNCADSVEGNNGLEPDPPTASTLNLENNVTSANLAVIGTDDDGEICLYTSVSAHLIVDVIGWFEAAGDSPYTSVTPNRVLETRPNNNTPVPPIVQTNWSGAKPAAGRVILLDLDADPAGDAGPPIPPAANAKAAVLNITGVDSAPDNFVTVYPCADDDDPRPNTSTLNLIAGETRPNAAVVALNGGKVCIYTNKSAHLIADLVGYFPG